MTGVSTWAQTDVTSTYITDADFSSTTNWTDYSSSGFHDINKGLIGTYGVRTNEGQAVSTVDATHLATEYCFGFECRWSSNFASYNQTKSSASLHAGVYTITFDVENTNSGSEAHTWDNLFYVMVGDTKYADESTEWMAAGSTSWTTHTISFTIEEAITADFMISLGYGTGSNNIGSAKTPTLHVSHLLMTCAPFIQPTALTLSASSLDMKLTQTTTLSVSAYTPANANYKTDITWTTSDASVATVDNGVVTAVGTGTATITATTANSKSTTCAVTVTDVTSVAAPAYYSEIAEGDFYIVNAATGKYLGGANSWGTQASQIEHGIPFTVAVSDGKYTLDSHTYNNEAEHFINGTYVDKPSTNLYVTSLGSGKYAISTADGSAFITANVNNTTVANTAANSSSPLAQWYFVSKANRDALFASATNAAPADATYYLTEANISRNLRKAYNTKAWTGDYSYGGKNENQCAERYCATTDVYQTVSVPNGKYTVKCQGFYRRQSGESTSYLYANGSEVALNRIELGGVNSMDGASEAFTNGEYWNTLPVYVTDGSLKVGIKCEATTNWTIWDNFTIAYHGPTVGGEATEIAMDTETAMTAGSWYYFDIPVDGLYNLTTTALSDIVYTTDGSILIENESSVVANFSKAENETLTTGRYFVKSASAQALKVTVGAYVYNVGSATVDYNYVQGGETVTLTFAGAATNDESATFALQAGKSLTFNGSAIACEASEGVFTFTIPEGLEANTSYTLAIPAGTFGYAAGETYNEAQEITFKTPAVFDGLFFLRATSGKYIARGSNYNTRAIVDEFGLPVTLTTNKSGISQFTFVDNNLKLFLNGSGEGYTDNTAPADWNVVKTDGGYFIVHANDGSYKNFKLGVDGDMNLKAFESTGEVWTLEPVSEHNVHMEALKDAQAAAAATAFGIDAITTKTALAAWLEAKYYADPITVPSVSFTEKWDGSASAEWGAGKDMYTNTISELPAGLYKLTVNAYYRINGSATAADGARGNTYLYGGSAKTQLYSLKDFPAAEAWAGRNQNDAAGYYPDDFESGNAATTSSYLTELYVYHAGGDFTYGIHQPSRFSNGEWFGYQNFTLTRYAAPTMVIGDAKYATFVAPFDVTIPSGVTAYTVDAVGAGDVLEMTKKESGTIIDANTPVVVYSESAKNEPFYGKTVAGTPTEGLLTGVYTKTPAPNGSHILQNQGGKVGFYLVDTSVATPDVPAFRAYLTTSSHVKAFYFGDVETAIKSVMDGVAAGEVYDLSGRKISKLQRGVNIVNGKKVMVK